MKPLRSGLDQPATQVRVSFDDLADHLGDILSPWKTTMATYDLEEQEQLDELKTWWTMYGNLVTGILVVVALAVAGWQGWNWWQRQQAVKASAVYSSLQTAAMQRTPSVRANSPVN